MLRVFVTHFNMHGYLYKTRRQQFSKTIIESIHAPFYTVLNIHPFNAVTRETPHISLVWAQLGITCVAVRNVRKALQSFTNSKNLLIELYQYSQLGSSKRMVSGDHLNWDL